MIERPLAMSPVRSLQPRSSPTPRITDHLPLRQRRQPHQRDRRQEPHHSDLADVTRPNSTSASPFLA